MTCKILVSNTSHLSRGDIVAIVDDKHEFTKNESMQVFLSSGGNFDDWKRMFSIVIVIDKNKEDINYLLDENSDNKKKWKFVEPNVNSKEWLELYNSGQIEKEFVDVNNYIIENI